MLITNSGASHTKTRCRLTQGVQPWTCPACQTEPHDNHIKVHVIDRGIVPLYNVNHLPKADDTIQNSVLNSVIRLRVRCGRWWSWTGSNRRPEACKATALPTELQPHILHAKASQKTMVGLGRLELPTSRLSSARSNQLSYRPGIESYRKPKQNKPLADA